MKTMKVKLLTEVARKFSVLSRGIHDLPEATAREFISYGWAVAVDPAPQVETAALRTTPLKGRFDARNKTTNR